MVKIGEVTLKRTGNTYLIVWYSDKSSNERIDVIENNTEYNPLDTSNCVASLFKGGGSRFYGNSNIPATILRIKSEAAFLPVAEQKSASVKDGKFYMVTSKENVDAGIYYKLEMVNGRIESELYITSEGQIKIDTVKDSTYNHNDHPINWSDYELLSGITRGRDEETVKIEQAEFYSYEELIRKYPQVTHVLDNDYVVASSYEEAEERLNTWINSKEQLKSVDIESIDTDWGPGSTNRITGVFLGFGETWSTYFPFRQQNFKYNLPIEYLRKIFNAINNQPPAPEVLILGHNVKFEIEGFYQEFKEYLRVDVDTYLLGVLVDPLIKKGSHTLKNLTNKVDGRFYLTLEQIFIGPVRFNVLPENIVKLYGCPDATSPAKVFKYLMEKLPNDECFVKDLEMRLPEIKAMNEYYGIRMDEERLNTLIEEEEYKVEMLSNLFKKIHRTSKNINSTAVLSDILYNKLRCKVEVRTDKGAPATSKYAIDKIIRTGAKSIDEDTPIPSDIVDKNGKTVISGTELASNKYPSLIIYQKYKLCQKELGALKRLKNKSVDGRFKFYINQVGAGSNRQTSDAHQFSDTMKSCALADSPHHQLVSCDWKQVELRILAGMADQKDLMELEADPDIDIHRAILSIIQDKPIWAISEEERKSGKSVNFGVVYMMSEYGLAQRDYGPGYTKEHLAIERKKIADFFNGLPKIKHFLKRNENFLKENGYIKTAFCYYRYFPELLDPTTDSRTIQKMVRSGNNTPVQGTGAQMLKIVETKVWEYIRKKGWDKVKDYDGVQLPMCRMILPIHDEILFSYDKSIPMEEICAMFKECMELDIKGFPPFYAAPAFINNWYDGKDAAYEVDLRFRDEVVEEYKKGNYLLTGKDYLGTLNEFRNKEIKDYMEDLVSKYKTPEEIAKHVTHASITHTLIESMLKKSERKKLTHDERILEATKRFMESLKEGGRLDKLVSMSVVDDDQADKQQYMDLDEWSVTYTYIDANGDLITELAEGDYEDQTTGDDNFIPEDELEKVEGPRFMYCLNECIIDLTGLDVLGIDESINQKVQQLCSDDAFYNVTYVRGYITIKTPYKIGYVADELQKIFDEELLKITEVIS